MNDTPRTDEAAFVAQTGIRKHDVVTIAFSETLERELNAALAANAELLERLRERTESHRAASARDVQTIQSKAIMLKRLADALALITEEYEDRRFQFGDEYLWQKHEGNNPLPTAFAALDAYESLKGEQGFIPANVKGEQP
jgi:hypothetical protein